MHEENRRYKVSSNEIEFFSSRWPLLQFSCTFSLSLDDLIKLIKFLFISGSMSGWNVHSKVSTKSLCVRNREENIECGVGDGCCYLQHAKCKSRLSHTLYHLPVLQFNPNSLFHLAKHPPFSSIHIRNGRNMCIGAWCCITEYRP